MPEPVILLSSVDIAHEEFITFLQTADATIYPDKIYDGRISRGEQHIWIALESHEQLEMFEAELEEQGRASLFDLIIDKLGDRPCTSILLDISQTPGSSQIAIKFACTFMKRWPCVIYDLKLTVYSGDELRMLYQQNQGLDRES